MLLNYPLVWNGQHLIFAASNVLDLFPKSLIEDIWLPCRLYEYYPLRISLDYTLYKIRWKRYPAEKSANQSALDLQPWKTARFGFFSIGDILFIYFIISNADMNFANEGWFFSFFKFSDYVVRIIYFVCLALKPSCTSDIRWVVSRILNHKLPGFSKGQLKYKNSSSNL